MKQIVLFPLPVRALALCSLLALSTVPAGAADKLRTMKEPCPASSSASSKATAGDDHARRSRGTTQEKQHGHDQPDCQGAGCRQSSTVRTGPGGLSSTVTIDADGRLSGTTRLPGDATATARAGNGRAASSASTAGSNAASRNGSTTAGSSASGSTGSSAAAASAHDGCANNRKIQRDMKR